MTSLPLWRRMSRKLRRVVMLRRLSAPETDPVFSRREILALP